MKKILQLWLGIALVLGMMSASVQAVGPNDEAEETEPAAAAAAAHASDSPTLANLPKEVIDRIVSFLNPTSAARLAGASRQMTRMVGDARIHHLKKALYQESRGPEDLPYMGLPVFHLERISDNLKQALSYYPPQQREGILKAALGSYELFAVEGGSRLANVAGTIGGMQHKNMYYLILTALGAEAYILPPIQKKTLKDLFFGYYVYYTDEGKKDEWMKAFRNQVWKPCGRNGLQRYILEVIKVERLKKGSILFGVTYHF